MAALTRHGFLLNSVRNTPAILTTYTSTTVRRDILRYKTNWSKTVKVQSFENTSKSLAARGFLRPLKPYEVPADVSERFIKVCQVEGFSTDDNTTIEDPVSRFKLFVACEKEFKHSLPNSMLVDIETIGQLRNFYETPVSTTTPLEALARVKLPKNLHIQLNYHRFHPETDTMFGGKTAFPKSSTLVTGLTYKKKYRGHIQKTSFP
ncbi:uncharacterized protein LOC107271513 [Cephus cinctus]|uniref:Large ribosomal subunit protein mL50 n=1 Tax=Cephus cinctus TaxID=211228 RepID=A0AAJ7C7S5_CEPCN|nr:uncharacterized protein LOC107271513 [Cephus cinctus]